jgi:hypothetical protein
VTGGPTRVHELEATSARAPLDDGPRMWLTDRGPLALIVFVTFWFRFALAGRNSYWLDELYSVQQYVLPHASAAEAVRVLGETSIHPPLYQLSLYGWVQWFGSSETATRTLSNLAVAVAVVLVHATVVRLLGSRTANVVALVFALSFGVLYYGLETRSYAFTILLASLSGYGLARLLTAGARRGAAIGAFALSLGNIGLLLTHYYNFFFWGAQAVVLAAFLVVVRRGRRRWRDLAGAVALYVVQLGIVAAIWGRTMLASYSRNEGRYATEVPDNSPLDLLALVTEESFRFGSVPTLLVLAAAIAVAVTVALRTHRDGGPPAVGTSTAERLPATVAITIGSVLGPVVLAYLVFRLAGAERVFARYLIAMLPALTLLLSVAVLWTLDGILAAVRRYRGTTGPDGTPGDAGLLVGLVVAAVLVVPGAVAAISSENVDWRGTAETVVAIVESDPDHRYTVWEPSSRRVPMFDFYFTRMSEDLRVDGTMTRSDDDRGTEIAFENEYDTIETHDYLVLPFVHQLAHQFPESLRRLDARYERAHVQLDTDGRGIIVYDLRGAPPRP